MANTYVINPVSSILDTVRSDTDLDFRYVNVTGDTMTGTLGINTNSTTALLVEQDGVKDNVLVVDTTNGYVGINLSPLVPLTVSVDGTIPHAGFYPAGTAILLSNKTSNTGLTLANASTSVTRGSLTFVKSNGTLASPTAVTNGDIMGSITQGGYTSTTDTQFPAGVFFYADGAVSSGILPTRISFVTGTTGAGRAERLRVGSTGLVSVGSTDGSGRFNVIGSTDIVQTIIKANATQTANLTEWQNSSGSVLALISSTGNLQLGTGIYAYANGTAYFGGNVRIKASSETATLTVTGDLYVNGSGGTRPKLAAFTMAPADGNYGLTLYSDVSAGRLAQLVTSDWNNTTVGSGLNIAMAAGTGNTYPLIQAYSAGYTAYANIVLQSLGGNVGIGITAPTAKLHIVGSADTQQLIVKANASQTANLTEWQNSSGTPLTSILPGGNIYTNINSTTALVVEQDGVKDNVFIVDTTNATVGINTSPQTGYSLYVKKTSAGAGHAAIYGDMTTAGADYIGLYGIVGRINMQFSSTQSGITAPTAIYGNNYIALTRTITECSAISAAVVFGNELGTITRWNGVVIQTPDMTYGGVLTNAYGLYIYNQNKGATLNYAIYTNAGLNRFGDQLSIVGSADRIQQIVKANATQTANLQEWQNSSGTPIGVIGGDGRVAFGQSILFSKTHVAVFSTATDMKGLSLRGYSGQTANLMEFQDSVGAILSSFDSAGGFHLGTDVGGGAGSFSIYGSLGGLYLKRTSTNEPFLYLSNDTASSGGMVRGLNTGGLRFTDSASTTNYLKLQTTGATFGNGTAGVDLTITIDGETNDGVLTWMEDEDYFRLEDDVLFNGDAIGFFGTTPVAKATELTDELTTITHTAPGTPDYAIADLIDSSAGANFGFSTKDEGNTVLSVIANLQARVNELETKLVAYGLLADAD